PVVVLANTSTTSNNATTPAGEQAISRSTGSSTASTPTASRTTTALQVQEVLQGPSGSASGAPWNTTSTTSTTSSSPWLHVATSTHLVSALAVVLFFVSMFVITQIHNVCKERARIAELMAYAISGRGEKILDT
ncbi:unnamed protein product, partial [Amoebophrya sp. A25]